MRVGTWRSSLTDARQIGVREGCGWEAAGGSWAVRVGKPTKVGLVGYGGRDDTVSAVTCQAAVRGLRVHEACAGADQQRRVVRPRPRGARRPPRRAGVARRVP